MGRNVIYDNVLENNNLDAELICIEDFDSIEDIRKINNYKTSSAKTTETITARTIIAPPTTIISNNNSLLLEDLQFSIIDQQNHNNNNLNISENNLINNNLIAMFPNIENNTAPNLYEDLENDIKQTSFNENVKLEESYIMSSEDILASLPSVLFTDDYESQIDYSSYTDMYNTDITNGTFNDEQNSENFLCIPPQEMHLNYSEQSNLSNSDSINIKVEEQMYDFNELLNDDDNQSEIPQNIKNSSNTSMNSPNNNLNINNNDNNNNNDFKDLNNFIRGEKRKCTSIISNNNNDIKKTRLDKTKLRLRFDTNPRDITDPITTPNVIDGVISMENDKSIKIQQFPKKVWFDNELMEGLNEALSPEIFEVDNVESPSTSFTTHIRSNSTSHTNISSRNSLSPFDSCDSNSTTIKIEENPLSVSSVSTYSDFSPAASPNSSVTKRKRGRPPVDHSFRLSPTQLKKLPDHKRKYYENRFKNNEASRVSRRNRKAKDDELTRQHDFETNRNFALQQQEIKLKRIVDTLELRLHSLLEEKAIQNCSSIKN